MQQQSSCHAEDVLRTARQIMEEATLARVETTRRMSHYSSDRAVVTEVLHPDWFQPHAARRLS